MWYRLITTATLICSLAAIASFSVACARAQEATKPYAGVEAPCKSAQEMGHTQPARHPSFSILTAALLVKMPPDKKEKTEVVTLLVKNPICNGYISLQFSVALYDSAQKPVGSIRVQTANHKTECILYPDPRSGEIMPVTTVPLTFVDMKHQIRAPDDAVTGHLVIRAGQLGAVQVLPLTITGETTTASHQGNLIVGGVGRFFQWLGVSQWVEVILYTAGAAAVVFLFVTWVTARLYRGLFMGEKMTSDFQWNASQSWISLVTGTGAILGTILVAGLIGDNASVLPSKTYIGLNLFFALVLLGPPLLFSALHAPTRQYRYRWAFLCAMSITMGAVVGELTTTLILVPEFLSNQALTPSAAEAFRMVLLVLGSLVFVYGVEASVAILDQDETARLRLEIPNLRSRCQQVQQDMIAAVQNVTDATTALETLETTLMSLKTEPKGLREFRERIRRMWSYCRAKGKFRKRIGLMWRFWWASWKSRKHIWLWWRIRRAKRQLKAAKRWQRRRIKDQKRIERVLRERGVPAAKGVLRPSASRPTFSGL